MAFPSSVQWSAPTYQAWTCALMSLKASTLFKSRTQWSGCRTKPNASIFKDVVVFTDMQFTAGKHPVGKKQPRKELLIWSKRKKKKNRRLSGMDQSPLLWVKANTQDLSKGCVKEAGGLMWPILPSMSLNHHGMVLLLSCNSECSTTELYPSSTLLLMR